MTFTQESLSNNKIRRKKSSPLFCDGSCCRFSLEKFNSTGLLSKVDKFGSIFSYTHCDKKVNETIEKYYVKTDCCKGFIMARNGSCIGMSLLYKWG